MRRGPWTWSAPRIAVESSKDDASRANVGCSPASTCGYCTGTAGMACHAPGGGSRIECVALVICARAGMWRRLRTRLHGSHGDDEHVRVHLVQPIHLTSGALTPRIHACGAIADPGACLACVHRRCIHRHISRSTGNFRDLGYYRRHLRHFGPRPRPRAHSGTLYEPSDQSRPPIRGAL